MTWPISDGALELHLCATNGVVVEGYEDAADGLMLTRSDGHGEFSKVTLRPRVIISAESDREEAIRLHMKANAMCYIARSVNFPVHHKPEIVQAPSSSERTAPRQVPHTRQM